MAIHRELARKLLRATLMGEEFTPSDLETLGLFLGTGADTLDGDWVKVGDALDAGEFALDGDEAVLVNSLMSTGVPALEFTHFAISEGASSPVTPLYLGPLDEPVVPVAGVVVLSAGAIRVAFADVFGDVLETDDGDE